MWWNKYALEEYIPPDLYRVPRPLHSAGKRDNDSRQGMKEVLSFIDVWKLRQTWIS